VTHKGKTTDGRSIVRIFVRTVPAHPELEKCESATAFFPPSRVDEMSAAAVKVSK
jgi:hypothetical protein